MSWKIGITTWIWTSPFTTDTVKLFAKIRELGYDAVEIPLEDTEGIDVAKVKEALEETGLECTVAGAFGPTRDFTSDDAKLHNNCMEYVRTCLGYCSTWGSKVLCGPMYSATGKARLVSDDQRRTEWDRAVKNVRRAAEMAADHGVTLAIEPLNRFETDLINTSEQVARFVEEIDRPAAGVLLDGFHMNIEEKDVEEAVRRVGSRVAHVHVSECDRGVPGSGQCDWDGLKWGLEGIRYGGVVCLESFTPAVKEIARAASVWRPMASSQDEYARQGLSFLRSWSEE